METNVNLKTLFFLMIIVIILSLVMSIIDNKRRYLEYVETEFIDDKTLKINYEITYNVWTETELIWEKDTVVQIDNLDSAIAYLKTEGQSLIELDKKLKKQNDFLKN